MKRGYRFIDHTADFGLEIFGADAADLFIQAAKALTELIADTGVAREQCRRTVEINGDDWADLMVNWLRELLYLWAGEEQLVCRVTIESLNARHLQAQVTTDKADPEVHQIRNEIKAVTYHQIEVGPYRTGWRAKVIFDI